MPVAVGPGDTVLAGTVNVDGQLRVRVTEARGTRTLDRLASAVGRALNAKSDLMRFVDRIAGALVPGIGLAALVAFALALGTAGEGPAEALARALATLVVSCPCALSLAVPLVVSASASTRRAGRGCVLRDPVRARAGRIGSIRRAPGQDRHAHHGDGSRWRPGSCRPRAGPPTRRAARSRRARRGRLRITRSRARSSGTRDEVESVSIRRRRN